MLFNRLKGNTLQAEDRRSNGHAPKETPGFLLKCADQHNSSRSYRKTERECQCCLEPTTAVQFPEQHKIDKESKD